MEGGILEPKYHTFVLSSAQYASYLVLTSSTLKDILSHRSNYQNTLLTIMLLFFSWQYSSPPFRFKELPVLDSISNVVIVWVCWALGYISNGRNLFLGKENASASKGWLLAFCTIGIHALGAAADIEADTIAGQRTIATVLGVRFTSTFSSVC